MENILLSTEIDIYIETMKYYNLEDIGTKQWMEWHGRLLKLNQQAVIEATQFQEEAVKEYLVTSGKATILVYEVTQIGIWKKRVLPKILEYEPNPSNTFVIYSVFYHEAACAALLEIILFHSNCCETLGDSSIDLLDYCAEFATKLINFKYQEPTDSENVHEEIARQKSDIEFDIGIRSISILRYFAEYLDSLPLSVTSRMYSKLDIPLLLTELMSRAPWTRTTENGNIFKYIGGKWQEVSGETLIKLTQTEAQLWIGLRQLLLDGRCLSHYEITEFRKNQLIKLQKYLHDSIIDQLSPLVELRHWLCQLTMSNLPPPTKRPFILEELPQIKENILSEYHNKWNDVIQKQVQLFFKQDHEHMIEIAQSLSNAYNTEFLEKFENIQINSCGGCGGNATKKCSRCKMEWYCSRNCQVKHWPQHKEKCDFNIGNN